MGVLSDLFGWLKDILSDIWDLLEEIWPIILLAVLIYFAPTLIPLLVEAGTWLAAAFEGWAWYEVLALGFGVLSAIDPELASQILENVGEVIGTGGEIIGDTIGQTLGAFLSSSGGLMLLGGVALFFLLSRDSKESEPAQTRSISDSGTRPLLDGGDE